MRNLLLWVHRFIGGIGIAYFFLVFVTGTLLVFGLEIQSIGASQMRGVPATSPASFGTMLDAAMAAHPDAKPLIVSRPPSRFLAAPVEMREMGETFIVWTDPGTGAVQGETSQYGLKEKIRRIHTNLGLTNHIALILVTSVSLVLLIQIVVGIMSQRRVWRTYSRRPVSGATERARSGTLHRWSAMWALPVLLVLVLTSVFYFAEALGFAPNLPKPSRASERSAVLPEGFDGSALDRAVLVAEETLPGLSIQEIYLPLKATDGITIRGQLDAWLVRPRANAVTVDPVTFEVLGAFRGEDLAAGRRLTEAADPLHFGTWGGMASRVIWLVAGLLMVSVAVSATWIMKYRNADGSGQSPALSRFSRMVRWFSGIVIVGAIVAAFVF